VHAYVELAIRAIREYVLKGTRIQPPDPLPPDMRQRAGTFVSIKKKGRLRGCIGTIEPARENIALEIIDNAISSASHDYRFEPVSAGELENLEVSVDVLSEPEDVTDVSSLDPKVDGIIVSAEDGRRGLLLPDLEGVDTVEQQIDICRKKAGIGPDEKISLKRFTVRRHK